MQYISSDTNVWIDFFEINRIEYPFMLDYVYCMSRDAIEDELNAPRGSGQALLDLGLQPIDIGDEELVLVFDYQGRYVKLSVYDAIALSIAKARGIVLLTGDKALRQAAKKEGIEVRGTLWILDQLKLNSRITADEYRDTLLEMERLNGHEIRLPSEEIRKRLERA